MNQDKDITRIDLQEMLNDSSLWAVVIGNLISLVMALVQGWDIGEIMWIYWAQSVIIGIINVIRMMSLESFSTKGLKMNDQPVPETPAAKRQVAAFFTLHYGFFHVGYAAFLWQQLPLSAIPLKEMMLLMICISGFVGSHSYSFLRNFDLDFKQKKPNLGTLMFYPYMRIIPMHLTIIFGSMLSMMALFIFMVLKILADVGMHMVEHHIFQQAEKSGLQIKD